ncbi:MAG TPA: GHKL domain-containing protein [Crenotrichaceae bacterium]|nr:GHKL domain-containing protein [Crenotrichaceae bacterium]
MKHTSASTPHILNSDALPDFCSAKSVLIALLLAELLAILLALVNVSSIQNFWSTVGLNCLFIIWVILPSQVLLCFMRSRIARLQPIISIGIGFAVIQLVTCTMTWVSLSGLAHFTLVEGEMINKPLFYLRIQGISLIVSFILLYHLYVQTRWKQQVQAELNARLQALQSRIQPHFLFNSLNTIASTVHEDPELAENLLIHMSELMRASLNTQNTLVTLTDELRLVHSYLNIESQRVGDRLSVEWNVDKSLCDACIPPLSLQPLVENAVYHGIEPNSDGGIVEITAVKHKRSVVLMVRNTLSQNDRQENTTQGHGIALENVTARVNGWFGDQGKVVFSTVDGWFQARIIIPYVTST